MTAGEIGVPELLAMAVARVVEADAFQTEVGEALRESDYGQGDRVGMLDHLQSTALDTARAMAVVAQAITAAQVAERDANPARLVDLGDEQGAEDDEAPDPEAQATAADDGPHALGCLFTADFPAETVGFVGGRWMVFIRYTGWIDATHTKISEDGNWGGVVRVRLNGRAVSRYNDRVLVITDGGVGMVLPADLVTLRDDE